MVSIISPTLVIGLLAIVGGTFAACPRPYVEGSYWLAPNNVICHCKNNSPVCITQVGKCAGWGDVHYVSFDRKRFDFQGLCRYILAHDCCDKTFAIEIEQTKWSETTSVSDKFIIRLGQHIVYLTKPTTAWVYNGVGWSAALPYDDSELRVEMFGSSVFVSLKKVKVWFTWNFFYTFSVLAGDKHKDKLCGICGDWNGNPGNDLTLTPFNEHVSGIGQWGQSWMVARHNQPARCRCENDTDMTTPLHDTERDCCDYKTIMNQCDSVINGPVFEHCRRVIAPAPYIDACRVEMCECGREQRHDCLCVGVSGYVRACREAGFIIEMSWTKKYNCSVCRDKNTRAIYEHGQSWTYKCETRTCDNGDITSVRFQCCKFRDHYYRDGAVWTTECDRRQCVKGKTKVIANLKPCGCYDNEFKATREDGDKWRCKRYRGCCMCLGQRIVPCEEGLFLTESPNKARIRPATTGELSLRH